MNTFCFPISAVFNTAEQIDTTKILKNLHLFQFNQQQQQQKVQKQNCFVEGS